MSYFSNIESKFIQQLENESPIGIEATVRKCKKTTTGFWLEVYDSPKSDNCIIVTQKDFEPGDRIRVTGTVELLQPAENEGEFDSRKYYISLGYHYKIKADDICLVKKSGNPVIRMSNLLRKKLLSVINDICPDKFAGMISAILLGQKDEIDRDVRDLFSAAGIGHILAISGLHISIIGMGLYKILRRAGICFTGAMIVGSAFIILYGVVTGNSISTVRAAIMFITAAYANVRGRAYDILSAASLSEILLLLYNPKYLINSGFILSFGAIIGIALIGENIKSIYKCKSKILDSLIFCFSIQLVTVPFSMYFYYEIPVLSVFINLIVIPLMTYVLCSSVVGIMTGCFMTLLGKLFMLPATFILQFFEWICEMYAKIPFGIWICGKPQIWQIVVYFILILLIIYFAANKNAKCLCLIIVPIVLLGIRFSSPFEMDFLSVGQGDGIYIQCNNKKMLIDGGSSNKTGLYEYTLEPFLMSKGVSRLDYAVITHCDGDHISGISDLLEEGKIKVDTLVMPSISTPDEHYRQLYKLAKEKAGKVVLIQKGDSFSLGKSKIFCLNPSTSYDYADINDSSTALYIKYGAYSFFTAGDISETVEERLIEIVDKIGPVDVFKASHHGSKYSNSVDFVAALNPKTAVISCGKKNRYGHPHEEVVDRFKAAGCKILRTDEVGQVCVIGNSHELKILTKNRMHGRITNGFCKS